VTDFTLLELTAFDAVAGAGSFQAAAARLHRTHPTVYTAIKSLEARLGLTLLNRAGYRVTLTEAGVAFHRRAQALLRDAGALEEFAAQLAVGQESELTIVLGDACPASILVTLLREFFVAFPGTRLHLHFEAISGPWERLLDREAHLIIHHIDQSDARIEFLDLFPVEFIPVVAPKFLPFPVNRAITPRQMRQHVQCIIRDSARHSAPRSYFVLEGANSWTVGDQLMKKELIVAGMGWGRLPDFLIQDELRARRLLSIEGRHFKRNRVDIVVARLRERVHGPVSQRLWQFMESQAPKLARQTRDARSRAKRA
jgi:DNA-binding transcriptional LysR family regulator